MTYGKWPINNTSAIYFRASELQADVSLLTTATSLQQIMLC
jgi:hypothetical protein